MAHPFFDELQFPAYREEAKELHRVLCIVAVDVSGAIAIYTRCGPNLPGLTPANIQKTWDEALLNLAARGFIKVLCDDIKANFAQPQVQKAVHAIEIAKPPSEITIIESGTLVLDREPLRNGINRIAPEGNASKVLLVRGEPKSGKSYVEHLFSSVARASGAESLYLFAENIPTLQKAVDQLFSLFAPEPAPVVKDANTTDPAWNLEVCIKLQGLAAARNKVYWIAVDDLGEKDGAYILPAPVRDFFDQFALQVRNTFFRKSFRLLYIHFPKKIPAQWKREIYIATEVKESEVDEKDIAAALHEWRDKTRKTLSDEKIITAAKQVLADAEKQYAEAKAEAQNAGEVPSRLEFIHYRLLDEFEMLEKN
jgi:hypothetical protein